MNGSSRFLIPPRKRRTAGPRRRQGETLALSALDDDELVPEFCDHILHTALETGTSDIHIEPFRDIARVRFRIDGRLVVREEYSEYLLKHFLGVVTRFKIPADCDISEKRLPQDGGITIQYQGEDIDFRFNVLPGKNGERIVMRILKGDPSPSLDKIGLSDVNYNNILEAITAPQGMVLVTGPTGSGKTTTLYGCLQHINDPELNIMTAEDPVEYYLEGVGQTQANEKIGFTFNSILRAFRARTRKSFSSARSATRKPSRSPSRPPSPATCRCRPCTRTTPSPPSPA